MKRTTLLLDLALYSALKHAAAREGRTLTEIVERTLHAGLRGGGTSRRPRVDLPSYDLGPFRVDPSDRERTSALVVPPPEPRR